MLFLFQPIEAQTYITYNTISLYIIYTPTRFKLHARPTHHQHQQGIVHAATNKHCLHKIL